MIPFIFTDSTRSSKSCFEYLFSPKFPLLFLFAQYYTTLNQILQIYFDFSALFIGFFKVCRMILSESSVKSVLFLQYLHKTHSLR